MLEYSKVVFIYFLKVSLKRVNSLHENTRYNVNLIICLDKNDC